MPRGGGSARPPPEISPGSRSLGAEPGALEAWGGEMGRPEQCGQSRRTLSKHVRGREREKEREGGREGGREGAREGGRER